PLPTQTLQLNGRSFVFASLSGTGTVGQIMDNTTTLTNAVITVGTNNSSTSFAGRFTDRLPTNTTGTGILGLTKVGTGALTVAGPVVLNGTYLFDAIGPIGDSLDLGANPLTLGPNSVLRISGTLDGMTTYTVAQYTNTSAPAFTSVQNLPGNYVMVSTL